MPHEMSIADIEQKFCGSVVLYEKKPVLFKRISGDYSCRIFDLISQKEEQVQFKMAAFTPPPPRIGMVNINGSVLYCVRNAIRRYKLGISKENFQTMFLDVPYPDGDRSGYLRLIQSLERKELGEALLNKYPNLDQALKNVSQFEGACAFDKQFCVDHEKNVFYKTVPVGKVARKQITFNPGFEQLEILLDKGYEKSH